MIYMDNAATTSVRQEVIESMMPYFSEYFGNPSSIYQLATKNKEAVEKSREAIATTIKADAKEIYFTSGGTESDNWVLENVAVNYQERGHHIVTSKIEHHAIIHKCEELEKKGFEITFLNVDKYGMINITELNNAIRDDTILVSVMFANNEVGTIEPIEKIGRLTTERNVLFHTDAVQAYGHVPIDVRKLEIDFLSASSHKFHGPKGVGFLYAQSGVRLSPLMYGGAQENHKRAGTENVPGIVGMAKAAQLSCTNLEYRMKQLQKMRDYLILRVTREIPFCKLNGHFPNRLPGNVNFSFCFVDAGALLVMLDMDGICASAGSACNSGSQKISHVLSAMGIGNELAYGTIRMTLDENVTKEEIDYSVDCLKKNINELRSKSEDYQRFRQMWR